MSDDRYIQAVNSALLSFQMLEESLKICIGLSYEIISASIPSEIDFKFSPEVLNENPLGVLITMFSKVSKNEKLVIELRGKKKINLKWRNFLAHSAFVHNFQNNFSHSTFVEHSAEDVAKVAIVIGQLVSKVGEEIARLQDIRNRLCNVK